MNRLKWTMALLGLLITAGTCFGQQPAEPSKFYKLDFVVKEVEGGKVVNSRAYSVILPVSTPQERANATIRTGSRVPTPAGVAGPGGVGAATYIDVGVNIDCNSLKELQNEVTLYVSADISSTAQETTPPVIRQNRWSSIVVVPVKKPTVIFASDDATSKRQMQLELTATPTR